MKKIMFIFMISIILLASFGMVFAETREDIKYDLEAKGKNVVNMTEIDPDNLPSQVSIEDIEFGAELSIYEVDVGEEKPIFAITSSGGIIKDDVAKEIYSRTLLNFGFVGEMNKSEFLKTSTGVTAKIDKGYVMIRKGSITGISTNLEVVNPGSSGQVEIIIYKNGEPMRFGNILNVVSSGIKKDYDIQSENIVLFEAGDIISVYAKVYGDIILKDIINVIEITTAN